MIQLRRPEHALRIEPQAAHEPHAGGVPGAEQRPASLLADRAERLACRIKHFHDVIGIAYGHVNRAVGADRDRLRGLQPRDHRLRGAVGSQPQHAASATDHKHAAIRPRLEIAGIFHSDLCHFVARRRVEHPHAILGGEVELAADHVEAREARLDRQAGGVFALPRTVVALLGIDTVDHRIVELVVVDEDDAVGRRDVARAAEAAALVPPLHVALEVGADDRLPRLRAGPAQNHRLAIGGHGAGIAVVAAPVAAGRIEGGLAGVVGPAHQPQADALMVDRIPGVAARLHDLARLQVALVGETVPEQFVRATGKEIGREQLSHHAALGILDVQGDVTVLRHVEGDLREALHLLGLEEPGPIDRGPAVPHRHGKLPSVGKLQLLRLDLARRCKRADAPAAECLEGEDAVRGDARPKDVFERDAEARRRVEVGLDREDDPAARLGHDAAVDECFPWQCDLLRVALAFGVHREGLPAADGLGVFDIEVAASLLLSRKGEVDHILALAVAPGRDPADGELSHLAPRVLAVGVGDDPQLQAVTVPAVVAGDQPGMAQGRFVEPSCEHVEVLGVVHRVDPHPHLIAEVFDVAADEDAAGEIPVVYLTVDRHARRGGQDADIEVFGLSGSRDGRRRSDGGSPDGQPEGCRPTQTLKQRRLHGLPQGCGNASAETGGDIPQA